MARGLLEVHLVHAKGLSGTDFLGKIDPYVVVQFRSQERKSSTAGDAGRNPSWNEVFRFQINSSAANVQDKLVLRIMDHDNFSSDDFLGQATINVTDLISMGMESGTSRLNPAKYRVVTADNSYHGEIKIGITFTAAKVEEDGAQVGSWKIVFPCVLILLQRLQYILEREGERTRESRHAGPTGRRRSIILGSDYVQYITTQVQCTLVNTPLSRNTIRKGV
ncbi:elicitor-responsive protein 1 [Triticum aestivum]|uniref:elicitor-responsive protein 1 n=1 Tax=Triticum aestivum TaxID=4565 RepID=UPI000842AE56|nr:elicitor-responsive protein 1-like [Triticum aestivum]